MNGPNASRPATPPDATHAAALAATLWAVSPDCLKRLDLAGNVIDVSTAGREALGLNAGVKHFDPCWFGWWDAAERGKAERAVAQAARGESATFEGWATSRDGAARCWTVTVSPIRGPDGRPVELLAASRDITEARARSALAAVNSPSSVTPDDLDSSADLRDFAIFALDVDGVVRSWNAGARALFGYDAADIVGRLGEVLWTPEDRAQGIPAREMATAAREGVASDHRWHRRQDGSRVFVDGVTLARRDADGRPAGYVKIGRDESRHRTVEDELARARARLDGTLAAAEVGVYEWDIPTNRIQGDANFRRLFGLPHEGEPMPLESFIAAMHPDDRAPTARRIAETLERGDRFETEYRIVSGDAPARSVIARGRVDRDPQGRPLRWAGVILDITGRKRAEAERQQIAEAQAQQARIYESILSTTDDFAYIFDLEGRVLYANRKLLEVWGTTLGEAVGKTFVELGYPVWHAAMHLREIDQVIRTRAPIQGEIPFVGNSGQGGVYDYIFSPVIGPDGQVERVVGTTRDVTARRHADDARRVIDARTQFLANLAESTRDLVDPAAVVATVAQRLGEHLGASRCVYADAADDNDSFIIHPDYCNIGVASCAGEYSLDGFGRRTAAELRAGQTLVVRDAESEIESEAANAFRQIECRAAICCPLIRAGRVVAMMAVHQTTPREWTANDISLVEQVVERAWSYIERARGIRELAESEARLRQLADAMPQIVFAATPDGTVDYFNGRWYDYTGLPRPGEEEEANLGVAYWSPVHTPDGLARALEAWPHAITTGEPYEIEYELRRHDGTYRWHLGRALPVRDASGKIVRWYGTNTDIHDQKLAETALATEKQVLEQIAGGTPVVTVLETLARGVETQSSGEAVCSILLVDPDGRTLSNGATPSLPAAFAEDVNASAIGPATGNCGTAAYTRQTVHIPDTSTHSHWTDFRDHAEKFNLAAGTAMPIFRSDGNVSGTVCIYYRRPQPAEPNPRDLDLLYTAAHLAGIAIERDRAESTVRKALDAERAARAESERAGRMKDEFLATLSHELRTPLSAMLGWSQILRREGARPETIRQGLETIERNARAQTQIIDDLLDMSRIISGKVVLDPKPLDLAEAMRAAVESVGPAAQGKGVELTIDASEAAPAIVDGNRMQQVFWNLLSNAVKFTPRGGRVSVALDREASQWRVRVADSGEGITADFLPFVFDRFRQADASTTRRHGGLGLGLAIVKQIVELHGGTASVESDGPGRGATFTVRLPMPAALSSAPFDAPAATDAATNVTTRIASTMPTTAVAPPSPPPAGPAWNDRDAQQLAGRRVLVIDDEADARGLLRHLLESCGAVVIDAPNAEAGVAAVIESLKGEGFDAIVSDIGMPGENGYAMLARIRALGGRALTLPAIALTAYARAEDRVAALRAGFQLHVPKPVEPAELITTVATVTKPRPGV